MIYRRFKIKSERCTSKTLFNDYTIAYKTHKICVHFFTCTCFEQANVNRDYQFRYVIHAIREKTFTIISTTIL